MVKKLRMDRWEAAWELLRRFESKTEIAPAAFENMCEHIFRAKLYHKVDARRRRDAQMIACALCNILGERVPCDWGDVHRVVTASFAKWQHYGVISCRRVMPILHWHLVDDAPRSLETLVRQHFARCRSCYELTWGVLSADW